MKSFIYNKEKAKDNQEINISSELLILRQKVKESYEYRVSGGKNSHTGSRKLEPIVQRIIVDLSVQTCNSKQGFYDNICAVLI